LKKFLPLYMLRSYFGLKVDKISENPVF